jgi:hypothetical protein
VLELFYNQKNGKQKQIAWGYEYEEEPMNKMEILGGTLAGMMFLSGCSSVTEANKNQATESALMPNGTATPEATAISVPIPARPDMADGQYNSGEQSLINDGSFEETETALSAWFKYWFDATNNSFDIKTLDIHYKYVFSADGKSAGVCLESTAYSNVCFALPIINGQTEMLPPTTSGEYSIPVGFGPLQLSDELTADQVSALSLDPSLTNSVLGWENGGWVRIKNGQVVGTLDMASATWKAENGVDKTKLYSAPASDEAFEANPQLYVKGPDAVADPQAFLDWINNQVSPVLGDGTKLEPNLIINGVGPNSGDIYFSCLGNVQLKGSPEFVYTEHNGVKYPVEILTVKNNGLYVGTWAFILFNGGRDNSDGLSSIKGIMDGNKFAGMAIFTAPQSDFPDDVNAMINGGIVGSQTEKGISVGVAAIWTNK